MKKLITGLAYLGTLAVCAWAGQTRTWVETDFSDFEKGIIKNLSLRSDGRLTLAPRFEELYDSASAYLWTLARDSKGNLYAGGGPGAKLYRISPGGEKKMLAEFQSIEIHAIVVDKNDRVYVATAPDGKVYRVSSDGKAGVFYDPKTKYIWALAFDTKGDLLVGTGDPGEIHRVTPDGKGSVFFNSEETHVRSMTFDGHGNLIAGTEPNGLVLRISPAGEGFVLYEMGKREITSVAVAKDGSVYAAGAGNKQASTQAPPAPPPAPPPQAPSAQAAGPIAPHLPAAAPASTASGPGGIAISGGSDLYRIHPDGYPEKVWSHAHDIVYSIGFDATGKALIGTGNKGCIYRVDSDSLYTELVNAAPTQVTALVAGENGKLYAATGNVGKVFEIGPGLEPEGSIESDVFDAGMFSRWGRLSFKGSAPAGRIGIETRSGNLDRPQRNWSAWSGAITSEEGARITSPSARFIQWRATLTVDAANKSGKPPQLDSVEVAYLPKNVAPRVSEIEITPPNYKFPTPGSAASVVPQTLNLPPMGKAAIHNVTPAAAEGTSTPALQYAKGAIGARWVAVDDNGDSLIYTVEIRGAGETEWKLLKDKVHEKYISWDSTAFPDGEYRLRVTASDLPGNTKADALTGQLESQVLVIDNTPPRITGLAGTRNGNRMEVRWHAADTQSLITKAEYSVDGGEWMVIDPVTKLSDSRELEYTLTLTDIAPGEHTVAVRVEDEFENQSVEKVVVR
jgi:sugar lactone lactonase YvrE